MAKADRYYFENFAQAAQCCCDAAKYLEECLKTYDYAKIQEMLTAMHALEHKADEKKHEMRWQRPSSPLWTVRTSR